MAYRERVTGERKRPFQDAPAGRALGTRRQPRRPGGAVVYRYLPVPQEAVYCRKVLCVPARYKQAVCRDS
jgi:hypothetical protein